MKAAYAGGKVEAAKTEKPGKAEKRKKNSQKDGKITKFLKK